MNIKQTVILFWLLLYMGMVSIVFAESNVHKMEKMQHRNIMMNQNTNDKRISLNLPPHMKAHQLKNMRSHVEAVQTIIGLIADGRFNKASEVAHSRLGLTEEMKKMCEMFENEDFKKLGLAFHKSADTLGDVLQTKDMNKSLRALHTTMDYCVQCHATFRQ